ncbi:MAG: M48 family peptidase [Proteobacteria bacterium]|nr:M48 family peptidase [Pseudomonadota bacterium]
MCFFRLLGIFTLLVLLSSCVTNPETGKKSFILISEGQEAQLGAQAYQEVLSKSKLSHRKDWNAVLQRVGKRISEAAHRSDFQWEFRLIDSPEKNAFCLPGGKVAVYTGIIPILKNEAGMAAVIGHEVAHATLRHSGQRLTANLGTQLGVLVLGQVLAQEDSQDKRLILAALGLGAQVGVILPFSRANESEADEIGLRYMARAGYDPYQAPKIWERFGAQEKGGPALLSTHPTSDSRKQKLQELIPEVLPVYEKSPQWGVGVDFTP